MLYNNNKIALVDCNSFYVSCERLFNPTINKKPVIVLSSNDGCVISRSTEAKNLGIKMGEPYFKVKKIVKENNVNVFSTNFALYGDISRRVMKTLKQFSPKMDIYYMFTHHLGENQNIVYGIKWQKKIMRFETL